MRGRLSVALLVLVCSLPLAAAGADPAPTAADAHEARRLEWTERLRAAVVRVERAEARYERAMESYSHMRHRRRARGSEKQAIMEELANSEAALQSAQADLGELRARARRAGTPPGWLRDAGAGAAPPARASAP